MSVKGYKVFNPNWTCLEFQYEVGKTYEMEGNPVPCKQGFHFCPIAVNCFNYYAFNPANKVAEVVAHGEIVEDDDKCVTNKIEIVRELTWYEVLKMVNKGEGNTGCDNGGNRNTGDYNKGNYNAGNHNTGDYNTGHYNTGKYNAGNHNTGNRNTGSNNKGKYNTGCNNKGKYNAGNYNIGNYNTGDFNLSSHTAGCFCTEEPKIRLFDAETDITFAEWHLSITYEILQELDYYGSGASWWRTLSRDDKKIIVSMPNFDVEKFERIMGIEVEKGLLL